MPDLTPIRNAMIVIAVSKYKDLPDLPGTLTSANRIAKWATGDSPARNYRVLKISDEDEVDADGFVTKNGAPVTVERLRTEIRAFLEEDYIDRLAVYFAGHGMAGATANDFWLLHNAMADPNEGVKFLSFKRLLEYQNIGAHADPDVLRKGQVCFIVDACRSAEAFGIDFDGNGLLERNGPHATLETDLYMSSTRGDYAFQPNAVEGRAAYCLFSDALSDALEGRVLEVIDTQDHPYAPVITSARLATWLEEELPKRAENFGEHLTPDSNPGFRRSNDYYEVFRSEMIAARVDDGGYDLDAVDLDAVYGVGADGDFGFDAFGSSENLGTTETTVGKRLVRASEEAEPESMDGGATLALMAAREIAKAPVVVQGRRKLALPRGAQMRVKLSDDLMLYQPSDEPGGGNPLFTHDPEDNIWTMVPAFGHATRSILMADHPGDVFVLPLDGAPEAADLSLTHYAALDPQRVSEVTRLADRIRHDKAIYPNNANRAGYLYQFASDWDNARRTAHYMANVHLLGFDLALVAADTLEWRETDGSWDAFARLPAVNEDPDGDADRPFFTKSGFEEASDVKLAQIFPVFREGWDLLALNEYPTMPQVLREISGQVRGGNITRLPDAAMRQLCKAFHYDIVDYGE